MHDALKEKKSGLKSTITLETDILFDGPHREKHIRDLHENFTKFLGSLLTNSDSMVPCWSAGLANGFLKKMAELASMNPDDFAKNFHVGTIEVLEEFRDNPPGDPFPFSNN